MAAIPASVTLWNYRRIPYVFDSGFPFQSDAHDAMKQWEGAAGVTFQQRAAEANYIIFKVPTSGGSNSHIGMIGGPQDINVNSG